MSRIFRVSFKVPLRISYDDLIYQTSIHACDRERAPQERYQQNNPAKINPLSPEGGTENCVAPRLASEISASSASDRIEPEKRQPMRPYGSNDAREAVVGRTHHRQSQHGRTGSVPAANADRVRGIAESNRSSLTLMSRFVSVSTPRSPGNRTRSRRTAKKPECLRRHPSARRCVPGRKPGERLNDLPSVRTGSEPQPKGRLLAKTARDAACRSRRRSLPGSLIIQGSSLLVAAPPAFAWTAPRPERRPAASQFSFSEQNPTAPPARPAGPSGERGRRVRARSPLRRGFSLGGKRQRRKLQ